MDHYIVSDDFEEKSSETIKIGVSQPICVKYSRNAFIFEASPLIFIFKLVTIGILAYNSVTTLILSFDTNVPSTLIMSRIFSS